MPESEVSARDGSGGDGHDNQWRRSRRELRRRETCLVLAGIVLHAVYMLSIFDIYFKSPVVHGMDAVPQRITAPAKRVVLIVGDGLRADKLFGKDSDGEFRAPFLRSVAREKGRWGISLARPPTESRPGHVSLIAGFYEDPSAITKGWKANPVEFDSVFNRSSHVFAFGSPGVVPIFCGNLQHSTWASYPPEFEDFASGSHGDGNPANTNTPLVAWGAGIRNPSFVPQKSQSNSGPTPTDWGLNDVERTDVNQADIAPLMATLIGSPCPVNSVGNLPLKFLNLKKHEQVEVTLSNTKQILNQFIQMSELKKSSSLHFKPFKPLEDYSSMLKQIEDRISQSDYEAALKMSQELRTLALAGLHYFQTYDWLLLMTIITLGYIGWILNLVLHILQSYTSLQQQIYLSFDVRRQNTVKKVYLVAFLLAGLFSVMFFLEKSPFLYHAYCTMTIFLWAQIFSNFHIGLAVGKNYSKERWITITKLCSTCFVAFFILEFLVSSFTDRKLYTWCFIIVGPISAFMIYSRRPYAAIFSCIACWFLSTFTLFPAEIPENTGLVISGGIIIVLVGVTSRLFQFYTKNDKLWSCIADSWTEPYELKLFSAQVTMVLLSSGMVWVSTSHRSQKRELLLIHQIINWSLTGVSLLLPLLSSNSLLPRLTSLFLGFAPPFLLLSIGYEAIFYSALSLVLLGWILVECITASQVKRAEKNLNCAKNERCLQLADLRVPLIFMVLFNVAFFGTGNFASIASFEISSVYRFVTVFSPFFMAALLIFKLFIPFMLVICVFSSITRLLQVPRMGFYFLSILLSDVMTIHFFFLVQNTGSWMEIGNSISHFGIMSAQVVFILLLFALTNVYTKGIKVISPHPSLKVS